MHSGTPRGTAKRDQVTDEDVMIDEGRAARLAGLGLTAFRRMALTGEVPGRVKFGRAVRYHKPTLLRWLEEQAQIAA